MLRDLTSLRLFVRAAESGKLGDAARQGNLAIAAASRRIALLEAEFGVKLFDRGRLGLTLTPAGSALLKTAKALLEQARAIDDEMADFAGGVRGTVRVHTNPSAITQFLPADLALFSANRPDVRIDLQENMSTAIVEAVAANRADLGIIIGGTATRGLETVAYRCDTLALLSPRGTYRDRTSIEFSEVQDRDFVGLVGSTALTRTMLAETSKVDRTLRLRMQVQSFDGVCRMVEAGFGLGVLPEKAARAFARSMELDVIPLADPWATRQMEVCISPLVRSGSLSRVLAEHLSSFSGG